MMPSNAGSGRSRTRERLGKLLREGGDVLTVENAARILGTTSEEAAKVACTLEQPGLAKSY